MDIRPRPTASGEPPAQEGNPGETQHVGPDPEGSEPAGPDRSSVATERSPGPSGEEPEVLYCYGHPKVETRLRCSRCDRPICGRCAIPASVGQHCPECVAEARRSAPKVRSVIRATAPVVGAILAVNVVVFVLEQAVAGFRSDYGMQPLHIAVGGEWWRLITAMFLHADGVHILLNGIVLWFYGPNTEEAYGSVRFAAIYLVSGFAGSAASYAFGGPFILSLGASGAIFGTVGALLVFLYRRRTSQLIAQYLRNIGTFIVLNLALGFFIANIDYWAHIGGLIAGIGIGLGLERTAQVRRPLLVQIGTFAAVAGIALVLVVTRTNELLTSPLALP